MRRRRGASAPRAAEIRRRIRRPSAHWLLLALFAVVLVVLLTVQGVTVRRVGSSATPTDFVEGESPLAGERSLLTVRGGRLVSGQPPPGRRVALTFDDGPDPTWTPRIARELRRLSVPATFFVVGSQVVRHPGIVRDLQRWGFELGNHTFTHADVSQGPGWRRTLELQTTENAVAGAAGVRPRLFRPPYSASPAEVTRAQRGRHRSWRVSTEWARWHRPPSRWGGKPGTNGRGASTHRRSPAGARLSPREGLGTPWGAAGCGGAGDPLAARQRAAPDRRARGRALAYHRVDRAAVPDRRADVAARRIRCDLRPPPRPCTSQPAGGLALYPVRLSGGPGVQ